MLQLTLQVFKGISLMSENTLMEIPTALVSFYHDHQDQKIPSIALASGSSIYIYRNMKPYFKFSLPDLQLNHLEVDLWMQVKFIHNFNICHRKYKKKLEINFILNRLEMKV